MRAIDTN